MKTEKNILIAFILNLTFSIFEFIGGIFTGSVAIQSDAVHDIGDAASIGISYLLERKAKKQPDNTHTYGYARYSVLGGFFTSLILLLGSVAVILNAVLKIINPNKINYDGMIVFAVIGVIVNFFAAYFTREGESINQKAVNLHMLEDVLGWLTVLVGAVLMRFTDFRLLDPIMSIGVAIFILISAVQSLKAVLDIFLEKTPSGITTQEITKHVCEIDGIRDVHHVHLRSLDGNNIYATMHVVTDGDPRIIKQAVRKELYVHGITHSTLELEATDEHCDAQSCYVEPCRKKHRHHH